LSNAGIGSSEIKSVESSHIPEV